MRDTRKPRTPNEVLAVTTLSHTMQHIFVGTSILFPLITAELNLNYTDFGLAIAISTLIGGLSQVIFGTLSRKIARHILLGAGNILLSTGTFLTGLSNNLTHFTTGRIISNIGIGPQHTMGTAIVSEKFESKNLGKAIGLHYGLAYIGNIIGPLFMTILAISLGWRHTLIVFSLPAVTTGAIVIWYLTETEKATDKTPQEKRQSLKTDLITLKKTKSIIPIIITQAFISGGTDLGIITTYTPLFLANGLLLDVTTRGIVYTIGLLGGVLGPIILAKYAERIGYLKMAATSTLVALSLVASLSLYDTANLILPLHLFALGLTSFALPTILQSHLVKITRRYERDLVIGLFFTIGFIFSSLWTGVMGYIIDIYASFKPAFLLMGTLGIIAFIILLQQSKNK